MQQSSSQEADSQRSKKLCNLSWNPNLLSNSSYEISLFTLICSGTTHTIHLSEDAKCKCGNEYQSMDHILFHCEEINAQTELLKQQMGTWPVTKEALITKYKKEFFVFIESIDFDNLKV
jgi:hypothetical protein